MSFIYHLLALSEDLSTHNYSYTLTLATHLLPQTFVHLDLQIVTFPKPGKETSSMAIVQSFNVVVTSRFSFWGSEWSVHGVVWCGRDEEKWIGEDAQAES